MLQSQSSLFQHQIGETAGKLWTVLGKEGKLPLDNISKHCGCGDEKLAHFALGWLTRENKVKFEKNDRVTLVSLTETVADNFKKHNSSCGK